MRKNLNLRTNIALGLVFAFLVNTFGPLPLAQAGASPFTGPATGGAGGEFRLPAPGVMVPLSPEFNPPILKGIKIHPDNPFRFDFILDKGDTLTRGHVPEGYVSPSRLPTNEALNVKAPQGNNQNDDQKLRTEANKLIKYFLASLTIPEKDLWVNLSPYEKDRIIPNSFGLTEMGRDLLAEDYMLKQITASLIYPEDQLGKKFWKRIYEEATKKFGTTNIPVNTFNKVWIVPEKAVVYENAKAGTAYVVESKLKVMLEEDYIAIEKNQRQPGGSSARQNCRQAGCQANEPMNVRAPQRNEPNDVELIYQHYLQAFKKGVYNYIKEESIDGVIKRTTIAKKYFSGGLSMNTDRAMHITSKSVLLPKYFDAAMQVTVDLMTDEELESSDFFTMIALREKRWRQDALERELGKDIVLRKMEDGVRFLRPTILKESIKKSGLSREKIPTNVRLMTIEEVLDNHDLKGIAFGLGNDFLIAAARAVGLEYWPTAYMDFFGLYRLNVEDSFIQLKKKQKRVFIFVPDNIYGFQFSSTTQEINWVMNHSDQVGDVTFVFGAYGIFNQDISSIFGNLTYDQRLAIMTHVLEHYKAFQVKPGAQLTQDRDQAMTQTNKNEMQHVVILIGASGSGKSTFRRKLIAENPNGKFFFPHVVTNKPRPKNEPFVDEYIFLSPEEFEKQQEDGRIAFGIWNFNKMYKYGYYTKEIEDQLSLGKTIILESSEPDAVRNVKTMYPNALVILLSSFNDKESTEANIADLKGRLKKRGVPEEELDRRVMGITDIPRKVEIFQPILIKNVSVDNFENNTGWQGQYKLFRDSLVNYSSQSLGGAEIGAGDWAMTADNTPVRVQYPSKIQIPHQFVKDLIGSDYFELLSRARNVTMMFLPKVWMTFSAMAGVYNISLHQYKYIKPPSISQLYVTGIVFAIYGLALKPFVSYTSAKEFNEMFNRHYPVRGIVDQYLKELAKNEPLEKNTFRNLSFFFSSSDTNLLRAFTIAANGDLIVYLNKDPKIRQIMAPWVYPYPQFITPLEDWGKKSIKKQEDRNESFSWKVLSPNAVSVQNYSLRENGPGGIDLTPAHMNLQTQNTGESIKFHLDSAKLAQLQNAPGFVPVIISIQPINNLREFLGR